ncbi:alcohol acetyltransferase [Thelonectria olida]|uniref:Alcohol acetyltransferase n=1 Tax=Thelonectria olida TaxID=1576542 RepID=A0A9P9AWR2_9HYPO|nr:alcohol acetyltransferase [Thelonectria olida]
MASQAKLEFLRYASPNERRTISREDLGFYDAVIIGATYEFRTETDVSSSQSFIQPLKRCIDDHPFLCVVLGDAHTDKAFYQRASTINLEDHISIVDGVAAGEGESKAIEKTLEIDVNRKFRPEVPRWRIVVLPLNKSRCFVAFAFSHTIGDGVTGMAFHESFLEGCRTASGADNVSSVVETPARPLAAPFDTPERLPISWSFLLAPLISLVLPQFLVNALGIRRSGSTIDAGTWTATNMFYDAATFHTKVKLREIDKSVLDKALRASRNHDAKLTATVLQLLARALSKALVDPSITNFVSQTAVNMRQSIGVPNSEMGEFASGCYLSHTRNNSSGNLSDEEWAAASSDTRDLATCASTLQDQPIGLLRYAPSIRKWTLGKIGQRRDCSIEMSNVGVFDPAMASPSTHDIDGGVRVTNMFFTQPGHVTSAPISFNFASVKDGGLSYTVSWQEGALGVDDEDRVVEEICASLTAGLEALE